MVAITLLFAGAAAYNLLAVPPQGRHTVRRSALVGFEQTEEVDPGEVAGLRVLKYPHPLLRAENSDVEKFDYHLKQLTKRMFKLMYASRGVGLAAPQVGINKRLMVVNWDGDPGMSSSELVLCNPSISKKSTETETEPEGCLSFPGFTADVARAESIVVEFQTVKGKPRRLELSGWEARVFQHEYDHLDGKLYATDRLSAEESERVQPELERLRRNFDAEETATSDAPSSRGGSVEMSVASTTTATTSEWLAAVRDAEGVYTFSHPDGEFEVHLRSKGRFWAPSFQCKSTWKLGSEADTLTVNFAQYGKYAFEKSEDGSFRGSAVGEPENWRSMAKKRSFSPAEVALMDSKWEFEHSGGTFEVEFRADAFNHFVCESYPAHSHWRLENADSPTPTVLINWGKFGEYELVVSEDGSSAAGSVKGKPDLWRKMTNLGALGADLKQYAEHNH